MSNALLSGLVVAGAIVALAVVLLLVGGMLFGARLRRRMFGGWQTTADTLHLTYSNDALFPAIGGTLDGIAVTAEIHTQTYTSMGRQRQRPWTRVRARLPVQARITVRHRGQNLTTTADAPPQPTGDAAFDAQYELYAPPGVSVENILPARVRAALLATPLRIHIWQDAAVWMAPRVVGDPQELTAVIRACTAVARAYRG